MVAGLLIPASLAGLGPRSGQGTLVAAWYPGLTVLALALAYRGRGLGRASGTAIIAGYLAFVTALIVTVEQAGVRPAAAVFPAAAIAGAGALLLTWPARSRTVAAGPGGLWQRESVLPGWSIGRLWRLSLALCCVVAACDAASGPHLILIGLLIAGPCDDRAMRTLPAGLEVCNGGPRAATRLPRRRAGSGQDLRRAR